MTIYADVLVIVNFYIDFFLLWCVRRFLRLSVSNKRLILGALAGGVLSLCALLPIESRALSLLIAAGTAVLTAIVAFAPQRKLLFLRTTVCFLGCTLGLAGFFVLLLQWGTPSNLAVVGYVLYLDLSPAVLFFMTCGAYAVFWLCEKLLPHGSTAVRCRRFLIEHEGSRVTITAKADTGCALKEPFSGLPVILCERQVLAPLHPKPEQQRVIPYESVGGRGLLTAFCPQHMVELGQNQPLRCYVAESRRPLSAGQFQAIYNPDDFSELI